MLTNIHIAVIGGDARQLEVIKKLVEYDAKVSLVGFDLLEHALLGVGKCTINEIQFSTVDAVLLPVPGVNLQGEIETVFSNEKIVLTKEILDATPTHCTIYSGISNSKLDELVNDSNRKLVCLFERDDVAIFNAIPTVEGTIMMVIQNTDITIHNSNVMVLGLGRVGLSVARVFTALGAKVSVGVRRSEHYARAFEMGFEPFYLHELKSRVPNIDVCINTVPSMIVNAEVISLMPSHTLIVDLASKPGGTDFRYAEKRGIHALLAPGLPGIVAPKTAGQILAKVVCQLLQEQQDAK